MAGDIFPTDKKPGDTLWGATLMNDAARGLNAFARSNPGAFESGDVSADGLNTSQFPPFEQVSMEITDLTNPDIASYKGRRRYYKHSTEEWLTMTSDEENEYQIDGFEAKLFDASIAEVVICYWDSQRERYVVVTPLCDWHLAKTDGIIAARSGLTVSSNLCTIWFVGADAGGGGNQRTLEEWRPPPENNLVKRRVYNIAQSAAIPANTYIQIARDCISGRWMAVWEDCP